MKISEVSIHHERELLKTQWKSPSDLKRWLRKNGFELLGDGFFAEAWAFPNHKRILKISKIQDQCWIRYAKWLMEASRRNPHLLRVDWVKQYKCTKKPQKYFLAVMERLKPFRYNEFAQLNEEDHMILYYRDLLPDDIPYLEKMNLQRLSKEYTEEDHARIRRSKLYKTLTGVRKIAGTDGKCSFDLHNENIMWRPSTKSVVVTDPFAGFSYF